MARPAPCARLGAVALAASPKMRILLEDVFHGNYVTPFILRISVLSIVYAGVSCMSFLTLNGAFQCSKSERIQFFCSSEQVWLP